MLNFFCCKNMILKNVGKVGKFQNRLKIPRKPFKLSDFKFNFSSFLLCCNVRTILKGHDSPSILFCLRLIITYSASLVKLNFCTNHVPSHCVWAATLRVHLQCLDVLSTTVPWECSEFQQKILTLPKLRSFCISWVGGV